MFGPQNITGVLERPLMKRSILFFKELLKPEPEKILILFDTGATSRSSVEQVFKGKNSTSIAGIKVDLKLINKLDIWKKLEGICRPEVIFATNTSALPITEMASILEDPGRMIGMHFFNPAHRMPLLEIICAQKTSDQTLER